MSEQLEAYQYLQPTERVRTILKAVSKHVVLQPQPKVPFLADYNIEKDSRIARILAIGFANMLEVHFTETCSFLCCEDKEYFNLLKKFDIYLCQPLPMSSPIFIKQIAARYIVKYRKVANELGLNGVSPYVGSKSF